MTQWVIDTAPLIFLTKLDRLDVLRKGADEILIPTAVIAEVKAYQDDTTRIIDEATQGWLRIQNVQNRQAVALLTPNLDLGEAEVIALAKEINAERVVLDDLDGRRFARRVGFAYCWNTGFIIIGTIA